ncbi:MAG: Asp-tRNA(Asn)/Glu-tRNA(Gln) amidotransferase subunit GatC [Burkholderiales bacterium]|nr:Asp-tRNA(Asn)/Glu-tRNA(Gln) amidotransferase subunit GatC [Pseudomonadota bacterium]
MELTEADIKRIARLARIAVSDQETETIRGELSNIFRLIETMQAVDTTHVAPMSHSEGMTQRLREDRVTETDQRQLLQSVAPQVEAGLYLVPKVFE